MDKERTIPQWDGQGLDRTDDTVWGKYIGARYVPVVMGKHNPNTGYEYLMIVTDDVGNSYTSRCNVPVGTPLSDKKYWIKTGSSSGDLGALQSMIETESASRKTEDDRIEALITNCCSTVKTDIATLNTLATNTKTALDAEVSARTTADATLTTALNTEVATRTSEVSALQAAINNLQTGSGGSGADALKLAQLEVDLQNEIQNRQTEDGKLNTAIGNNTTKINTNTTDIANNTSKINTNTSAINTNTSNLNAEIQTRTTEDAAIMTKLNQEIADRTAEVSRLDGLIAGIGSSGGGSGNLRIGRFDDYEGANFAQKFNACATENDVILFSNKVYQTDSSFYVPDSKIVMSTGFAEFSGNYSITGGHDCVFYGIHFNGNVLLDMKPNCTSYFVKCHFSLNRSGSFIRTTDTVKLHFIYTNFTNTNAYISGVVGNTNKGLSQWSGTCVYFNHCNINNLVVQHANCYMNHCSIVSTGKVIFALNSMYDSIYLMNCEITLNDSGSRILIMNSGQTNQYIYIDSCNVMGNTPEIVLSFNFTSNVYAIVKNCTFSTPTVAALNSYANRLLWTNNSCYPVTATWSDELLWVTTAWKSTMDGKLDINKEFLLSNTSILTQNAASFTGTSYRKIKFMGEFPILEYKYIGDAPRSNTTIAYGLRTIKNSYDMIAGSNSFSNGGYWITYDSSGQINWNVVGSGTVQYFGNLVLHP